MGDLSDRLQNGPSSSGQAEGCAEGCLPEGLPGQMQAMVAGSGPACGPTAVVLTLQAHQQTAHVPKPGPAHQPSMGLLDRSTLGVCATFTVQVRGLEGSNGSPVQQPEQLSKPLYTASTGGMVVFLAALQPPARNQCFLPRFLAQPPLQRKAANKRRTLYCIFRLARGYCWQGAASPEHNGMGSLFVNDNFGWINCAYQPNLTLWRAFLDILGCGLVVGFLHANHCSAKA